MCGVQLQLWRQHFLNEKFTTLKNKPVTGICLHLRKSGFFVTFWHFCQLKMFFQHQQCLVSSELEEKEKKRENQIREITDKYYTNTAPSLSKQQLPNPLPKHTKPWSRPQVHGPV